MTEETYHFEYLDSGHALRAGEITLDPEDAWDAGKRVLDESWDECGGETGEAIELLGAATLAVEQEIVDGWEGHGDVYSLWCARTTGWYVE